MEIVLLGTKQYRWAVDIFVTLFRKHWCDDPIIWYGDDPGPGNPLCAFRPVPCFSQGIWPWDHHFGRGLASILDDLSGEIVALFLPDHWISAPVDHDGVWLLERFMMETGKVMRGNLTAGTCLDGYGKAVRREGKHDIVVVAPTDAHCSYGGGLTLCPSLWNRKALRDILEPGWSLWDVEKVGTEKFARTLWQRGWVSAGVRPGAIQQVHGLYHAKGKAVNFTGLSEEDFQAVRGLVPNDYRIERS